MNTRSNDTRLSTTDLEAAVDFAYGGAAVRAGRTLQARAVANFFRRKAKPAMNATTLPGKKA
jgi:hypothetical protein